MQDKLNAVNYLASTCDYKLHQINRAMIASGKLEEDIRAEDIYAINYPLIDKLYLENNGNIESKLSETADTLI